MSTNMAPDGRGWPTHGYEPRALNSRLRSDRGGTIDPRALGMLATRSEAGTEQGTRWDR